ncbi:T-lymphocyte activation antigen CD86 isoform X2 [Marmota marmota marmota]|uniref:T-lymphocyte activation antigen CD86 isoform X2 n=1 Tax=Marmota marmota marmota TaxID=9994 RepID=UPI002093A8F6|nr:T-lymphocyte activation antigen CD86 isoform X2 [Marmota marmota marmota]
MGISDSTMGLRITLFVTAFLLSDVASLKSQASFNETADLPCQFINSQNISLGELIIFWQDQQKLVLYELYLGNEKPDNVAAKYLGRTSFDQDNWTMQLHNVQIKDKGSYQCIVHHKGPQGIVHLYQMTSELSVFANFSEPEIRPLSNITGDSGINLTCSSSQGHPPPLRIYFVLETQNSTVEHDGVMVISQDNETELYNVSASLSVPFPDDTSNVTITCFVCTASGTLKSPPFNTVLPTDSLARKDQTYLAAFGLLIILSMIFVVVLCLKKQKRRQRQQHQQTAGSSEETIKMESEETKERVEIHEPEQNDEEVQCIVHYSKTPSGNHNATHF